MTVVSTNDMYDLRSASGTKDRRWPDGRIPIVVALMMAIALVVTACQPPFASPHLAAIPGGGGSGAGQPASGRWFAPTSFWNTPVAMTEPRDPASVTLVAELVRQKGGGAPWINTDGFSAPVYIVPANTRRVKVDLTVSFSHPAVLDAFSSVPVPPDAKPAHGEGALVIHQPSTDTMWEFLLMEGSGDQWKSRWGGRLDNVSTSDGIHTVGAGSTATGLAIIGGTMTLDELDRGQIDHVLAMAIPNPRKDWFTWPANRTDGSEDRTNAIPEGARFVLDPDLNLDSLGLSRPTRVIAEAAQKYGLVVRDRSGGQLTLYGEDPTPSGRFDSYTRFFEGRTADHVMADFPWEHLELLQMTLERHS